MPRREIPLLPNCFYHVYNRGHNYSNIFVELENYSFFLHRLRQYVAGAHAEIIAYVLMPNHYHLLLRLTTAEFSHAMQVFTISYAKAMNKRYQRAGSIFQSAFQTRLVDRNEYLLHLSRYIHLNPVQANLVEHAEDWAYSSYLEYIGIRKGTLPHPEIVLDQFQSPASEDTAVQYRRFVEDKANEHLESIAHLILD